MENKKEQNERVNEMIKGLQVALSQQCSVDLHEKDLFLFKEN